MTPVDIYTDGACSGNPGPGGWAAVLIAGDMRKEISGYDPDTTNNRMELYSAISALETLKRACAVKLYSDSAYLVHAFNKDWLNNWQRNGWRKADKSPVENRDLWQRLLLAAETHDLTFIKVKGHASSVENNRCDALARGEIKAHLANPL